MTDPLPPLADLLGAADVPDVLGPIADALRPVLSDLRYDRYRVAMSPDQSTGRIELAIVARDRVSLEIGGPDGLALVLNPDHDDVSSFPAYLEWRWPAIGVVDRAWNGDLPTDASGWFALINEAFSIDVRDLIDDAFHLFFSDAPDPVAAYLNSFNQAMDDDLSLMGDPTSSPTDRLLASLSAIDNDAAALVVEHLVSRSETGAEAQLARLVELLGRWLGSGSIDDVITFFVPDASIALERTSLALEVPRSWLLPLDPAGHVVPAPARASLRAEAGTIRASTSSALEIINTSGFHLDRAVLLGTGLTVGIQGAMPAFGVGPLPPLAALDGRSADFVGLTIVDTAVGLPVGWVADGDASTAELFVHGLVVGTGGVSGVVGLRGRSSELAPDGTPGPLHVSIGGPSGVQLRFDQADLAIERNTIVRSSFAGGVALPGLASADGNTTVFDMMATLDAAGNLTIDTSGEIHLSEGLSLGPTGTKPVLRAVVPAGDGDDISFSVDGQLRLPCGDAPGCVRSIGVSGSIELRRSTNGTWNIEQASIASAGVGVDWVLPGGLTLSDFVASILWSTQDGFVASVGGSLSLDDGATVWVAGQVVVPDPAQPTRVSIDGAVELSHVDIGPLHVIYGAVTLHAATEPAPAGHVRITGTAGLRPVDPPSPAPAAGRSVDDFDIAITDLDGSVAVAASGLELRIDGGAVQLPARFAPAGAPTGTRPEASLTPAHPILVAFGPGGATLAGAVVITDLGVVVDDMFAATLDTATLEISSVDLARLTGVFGTLQVPLGGGDSVTLQLLDASFALDGVPEGTIALAADVDLDLGGGFALRLVGGPVAPASGGVATGLTVVADATGAPIVRIDAALQVRFPTEALTLGDGSTLDLGGAGHIVLGGGGVELGIETVAVGGTFRLGGADGLLVDNALITATGLPHLLAPSTTHPVVFDITGMVVLPDGGPGLGLRGARFILDGSDAPSFDLGGFDIAPGEVLSAGDLVPVQLHEAGLTFLEPLPFPERLAPDNLAITLSGSVSLPLGDGDGIGGAVDDLVITFDDGVPQLSIDGIGLQVSGVKLSVLEVGGEIYIGGLADPSQIFFAGRVDGTLSGVGVKVLVAFRLTGPIGGCIDISLGPAGIPLGQTGILLTGIAGGVSFANTGGDPCDFRSYVQLGDDGRPIGSPAPIDTTARQATIDPNADPPATRASIPDDDDLAFPAPSGECPPASMNILAQPHPDAARYPDAVIYKFSAVDEQTLNDFGITRELVESWGLTDASQMAAELAASLRAGIESLWPPVPAGLDEVAEIAEAALDAIESFVEGVAELAFNTLLDAAGGSDDVYDAVIDLAWAGIPVADITIKLTGTFSYVGVSAFLSVTGGFVLSTTGSAGIVGSLNLFGLPIGTFKGFVTATDAMGLPNPSLCGEVKAAIGPLSLGTLRLSVACPGGVTGMVEAVIDAAGSLTKTAVRNGIRHAAPRIRELPTYRDSEPHESLDQLTSDEAVALLGHVVSNPPASTNAFTNTMIALLEDLWDAFSPEVLLAGSVQPKLFGLPLAGDVVGVSAYATKTEIVGQFRFSPSFIISYFLGNVLPAFDQATLGFRVTFPDPADAIRAGMTGAFADTAELVEMMEGGLEHVLSNATFTISYAIAPFGLELADAQARLVLPELGDHPDTRVGGWTPPEFRPGSNFPSCSDILAAALDADVLGDPLWTGDPDQLAALEIGDADAPVGLDFRRDYYPHGGFVGAGHLSLPRLLVEGAPPELLTLIFDGGAPLLERATAMVELVSDWIMTTVDIGRLAFAMPCPSLPAMGQSLMGTLQAAAGSDLPADPASIFPLEQVFFRGVVDATILGVPIGRAEAEIVGTDTAQGVEGYLRIDAAIPENSWLSGFLGSASVEFTVTDTPEQPVRERFGEVIDLASGADTSSPANSSPGRLADLARGRLGTAGLGAIDNVIGHASFRRPEPVDPPTAADPVRDRPGGAARSTAAGARRDAVGRIVADATTRATSDLRASGSAPLVRTTSRTGLRVPAANADKARMAPDTPSRTRRLPPAALRSRIGPRPKLRVDNAEREAPTERRADSQRVIDGVGPARIDPVEPLPTIDGSLRAGSVDRPGVVDGTGPVRTDRVEPPADRREPPFASPGASPPVDLSAPILGRGRRPVAGRAIRDPRRDAAVVTVRPAVPLADLSPARFIDIGGRADLGLGVLGGRVDVGSAIGRGGRRPTDDSQRRPARPAPADPPVDDTSGTPLGRDLNATLAALADGLPKVSLHVLIDDLRVPTELADLIGVRGSASAELHAYSIAFDPEHRGTSGADRVRRQGGMVLGGSFSFAAGFGLDLVERAELVIAPGPAVFPDLAASLLGVDVTLPGGFPVLDDADVSLRVPGGNNGWRLEAADFVFDGRVFGQQLALSLLTIDGRRTLAGQVGFDLDLDLVVGPLREPVSGTVVIHAIHLDIDLELDLGLELTSFAANAMGSGRFRWAGESWTIPPLRIEASIESTAQLIRAAADGLLAQAEAIFAPLLTSVEDWLAAVADGLVEFRGDVAAVLGDVFGVAADVGAAMLAGIGWTVGEITAALDDVWQVAADVIVAALDDVGATIDQIADALARQLSMGRNAVAGTLADAGHGWSDIAGALGRAFSLAASQLATALGSAGAGATDIAAALEGLAGMTADLFAAAMQDAGFAASEVGKALHDFITTSPSPAATALRNAGYDASSVSNAIHDHFTTSISAACAALAAAGYGSSTVARQLADVFGATAVQVVGVLLDSFEMTADMLTSALEAAQFAVGEIAAAVAGAVT